jgi:hypothetical protein
MPNHEAGWGALLSNEDAQGLWDKLFNLISRHSSVRWLSAPHASPAERLFDINADLTQELFLRLHQKQRWQFYVTAGYDDRQVDHELYHIEVPNLISCLLRKRYPESYRLARRISVLLQTREEFRHYPRPIYRNGGSLVRSEGTCRKHVLKVYGLKCWPADKAVNQTRELNDLVKDVSVRMRNTRRAGRGSMTQVIISNAELLGLVIDIFEAIDSPAEVRTVRSLVLSKLAIEDSRFVSIDAEIDSRKTPHAERMTREFADDRPTPEELLIEKERFRHAELMAEEVIGRMWVEVRHKPRRFNRLLRVAWHCYFDEASPSQNSIARALGISDSLVSHYRKSFDRLVRGIDLSAMQADAFKSSLGNRLALLMSESQDARRRMIERGSGINRLVSERGVYVS